MKQEQNIYTVFVEKVSYLKNYNQRLRSRLGPAELSKYTYEYEWIFRLSVIRECKSKPKQSPAENTASPKY